MSPNKQASIVYTNQARCRDCYRCVRACPVKAIRIEAGQASVDPARCLSCGTCIRECPQQAKTFRNDIERVRRILAEGEVVAVSVAPSFAGFFEEWQWRRLPSALRRLGFAHVAETAVGAWHAAQHTARHLTAHAGRAFVESSCPAVVAYVEMYAPARTGDLMPVCSPMLAHAALLRQKLPPRSSVVFIGPCVAKKAEAERSTNQGLVDAVLTFSELGQWFAQEGIDIDQLEESDFDEQPGPEARYYPLLGGCMRTASLGSDRLSPDSISVNGIEEIRAALALRQSGDLRLVEALFCPEGCVGGPAMPGDGNPFDRRQKVLRYARSRPAAPAPEDVAGLDLHVAFRPRPVDPPEPVPESAIRAELERTGKFDPESQLNCGGCGYDSCREKAIAVVRGLAEAEMCLPYMRRLAEGRTDRIIETSPNGILMLDEHLKILHMNPAFRRLFACTEAVLGRHVSYLLDPDPFERLATGSEEVIEATVEYKQYHSVCRQIMYGLHKERQYVGIFVNITEDRRNQARLETLRVETLGQAQELLDHQLRLADEMTRFLGENTARGEEIVEKLVRLVREGATSPGAGGEATARK